MAQFTKDAGVWKPHNSWVKHNGVWKYPDVWVRDAGVWKNTIPGDANFAQTVLLLHAEGANGSKTLVNNGSATIALVASDPTTVLSTTRARFGETSIYPGNGLFRDSTARADFNLFGGDFTIEMFLWFDGISGTPHFFQVGTSTTNRAELLWQSGQLAYHTHIGGSAGNRIGVNVSLATGQWYHVALTKSGSSIRLYLDGVHLGVTTSTTYPTSSNQLIIGGEYFFGAGLHNGYIDEVRVIKGFAKYTGTGTFVPPSTPFMNR